MKKKNDRYRENLQRLDRAFPTKELLNTVDVAEYCGMSRQQVVRVFPFTVCANRCYNSYYISKTVLAELLS